MNISDRLRWLGQACVGLRSVLREIFDEAAYARFLGRQRIGSSREAYRAFLKEQQAIKGRRVRCC